MKILLADDHAVFRDCLTEQLKIQIKAATLGEAASCGEILEQVRKQKWDVLLLDLVMPDRSGFDVIKDIHQASPGLPILILSGLLEKDCALRVFKAGAAGFVSKTVNIEVLIEAIHKVAGGGKYITPSLAEDLACHMDAPLAKLPHEFLTDREYEVLREMASGKTAKEIASNLSLSIKTISTHRAHILKKMKLSNNAQLMRYAMDHHIA